MAILVVLGLVALAACGGGGGGGGSEPPSPPTLSSIAVTPAGPSIPLGSTQQFTATGNYSDGSTQNLTTAASDELQVTSLVRSRVDWSEYRPVALNCCAAPR